MELVFRSQNFAETRLVHSMLIEREIACLIKNDHLDAVSGGVLAATWPEVWVVNDTDAERARSLVAVNTNLPALLDWACAECGETIEGQFDSCWKCGAEKPVAAT